MNNYQYQVITNDNANDTNSNKYRTIMATKMIVTI